MEWHELIRMRAFNEKAYEQLLTDLEAVAPDLNSENLIAAYLRANTDVKMDVSILLRWEGDSPVDGHTHLGNMLIAISSEYGMVNTSSWVCLRQKENQTISSSMG